jgi:hypothetical protein
MEHTGSGNKVMDTTRLLGTPPGFIRRPICYTRQLSVFLTLPVTSRCLEFLLSMRQTHNYSASQYVRDTGFPLTWMCRCCITSHAESDMQKEAEEYHLRNKTPSGTVIGRPAGYEAYRGRSTMQYQHQSSGRMEQNTQRDDKSLRVEATSQA